jgi:hypothetical protein
MAIYSTLYGLPQSMVDYLNQALPDISNLGTPPVRGMDPSGGDLQVIHKVLVVYTRKLWQVVVMASLFTVLIQEEYSGRFNESIANQLISITINQVLLR